MLRRWIGAGQDPATVTVVTRRQPELPPGVAYRSAPPTDEVPDIVVLAVKPQQIDEVASVLAPRLTPGAMLVSILAGVEEAALAARFEAGAIVRAMPNLPVAIGQGVVALHSDSADAGVRARVQALMTPLGLVEWVDDAALFDAMTALAGCGPGFVFRFIDSLAAAGTALGLSEAVARRLAIATVRGSATMAAQADVTPAVLADRVASSGGSTREGLNVLDRDDALRNLMTATLRASADRNAEMAAAARR